MHGKRNDLFLPFLYRRSRIGALLDLSVPIRINNLCAINPHRKTKTLLPELGRGSWQDFYRVCDEFGEISLRRPFYPNCRYKGRRREDLFRALGAASMEPLFRKCELGGNGAKRACCLFWTLGGNQVGKAAISGWRDVLALALQNEEPVSFWPFDGPLLSLQVPGRIVVAETYPAECYGWVSEKALGSKSDLEDRRRLGIALLDWAGT